MILAFLACLSVVSKVGPTDGNAPERIPVVLTTDCGTEVDDQWALAHLATSPRIDLKGVVTTHAPNLPAPAAESSARSARELLGHLGLPTPPPVLAGSSKPLADRSQPRASAGVDFLLEQAQRRTPANRLTVLVIGAATDAASALLIDPTWGDRVTIVAMAFDGWPHGGDVWNVRNDVKAWQVLLESHTPVIVGDADVTRRSLSLTRDQARARVGGHGAAGDHLATLVIDWLDRNGQLAATASGSREAWPIWDEVTVAHLLGLTRTAEYPRPALRDDLTFDHAHPRGTILWITAIESKSLWNDLAASLDRFTSKPRRQVDPGTGGAGATKSPDPAR